MCNIYTNEHFWVIGSNTSKISEPYVGQPCQCGSVLWKAVQQKTYQTIPVSAKCECECGGRYYHAGCKLVYHSTKCGCGVEVAP